MIVRIFLIFHILLYPALLFCKNNDNPNVNYQSIWVHYMPWFNTPEIRDSWGYHWTMNYCDPEQINAQGNRNIASYFTPLIGPYDSTDLAVLRYHALLMKAAGIDGVFIEILNYGIPFPGNSVCLK
ncbi:MAG: hypothetical protein PF447_10225 [Spirochaetaceae bacterium]|jgi:glycoprotein endo-alpha-1,2-mannosidase|nr:hypothetical protein [Spirochaetaceae bacterium]